MDPILQLLVLTALMLTPPGRALIRATIRFIAYVVSELTTAGH